MGHLKNAVGDQGDKFIGSMACFDRGQTPFGKKFSSNRDRCSLWLGAPRSTSLSQDPFDEPSALLCGNGSSHRIYGLRNSGTVGIGNHVPSILNQVQVGALQRLV
jgi:hypothetical protein